MNVQPAKMVIPTAGSTAARADPVSAVRGSRQIAADPPSAPAAARVQAQTNAPQAASMSSDAARQIASQINDYLKSASSDLQFAVDGDSGTVVVRIVDSQTKEVIRQIPSEEMLAISRYMGEMSGKLLQQKA